MEAVAGGAGRSSGQGALSIAQRGRVNKDLQGRSMALVFPFPAVPAPSRAEPSPGGPGSAPSPEVPSFGLLSLSGSCRSLRVRVSRAASLAALRDN